MIILEQVKSIFRILNHPNNKKNRLYVIGKILWWKINQYFFHLPAIIKLTDNVKCICYPTSSYGGLVVYSKLPEYPEMLLIRRLLKPRSIFFDIGANIGAFTLLAASKIKQGKIYSFEPIPSVLDILYENIRLNNFGHIVKVVNKVVSDKDDYEKFVICDTPEYSHMSPDKSGILIPSIRLDNFCKKEKIDYIDIIKIDIEGAALIALRGLEHYLKFAKVGILIVELSGDSLMYNITNRDVVEYLNKFQYQIFKLDNNLNLNEIERIDIKEPFNVISFHAKNLAKIKTSLQNT